MIVEPSPLQPEQTPEYEVTYGYDAKGRLDRVVGRGVDSIYGVAYTRFVESSANLSDIIEHLTFKSNADATLARG